MADDRSSRRTMLGRTDALLDRVEELRLLGATRVPAALNDAIGEAANSIGLEASEPPATLGAAHRYLLKLQGVLMAGANRALRDQVPMEATRPIGAGDVLRIALPSRSRYRIAADWEAAVRGRVQRGHDTTGFLTAQSAAAAIRGDDQLANLRQAQADAARRDFGQLCVDAEQLLGRPVMLDPPPTVRRDGRLELGGLAIDFEIRGVVRQGRTIKLGEVEFDILAGLVSNAGRVVTREALMHLVYGDDPTMDLGSRRIDVHLAHVREKVGGLDFLATVRGTGWRVSTGGAAADESARMRETRRRARRAWAQRSPAGSAPEPGPALTKAERWSVRRMR